MNAYLPVGPIRRWRWIIQGQGVLPSRASASFGGTQKLEMKSLPARMR
jgi:hypothetical protein